MNQNKTYALAHKLSEKLRKKYKEVYQVTVFPSAWYSDYFELSVRDLHDYNPRPHDLPLSFCQDVRNFVWKYNNTHSDMFVVSLVEDVNMMSKVSIDFDEFYYQIKEVPFPFRLCFEVKGNYD